MLDDEAPLIELIDVEYTIDHKAILQNCNLKIYQGDRIALLGKNASGKSTLLQLILGLKTPTQGVIKFHPCLGKTFCERKKVIGSVMHTVSLDKHMTVKNNIQLTSRLYGFAKQFSTEKVEAYLNEFELLDFKEMILKNLSFGTQRRVDIARAFLHQPKYLIFDETTSGLDVRYKNLFWSLVNNQLNNHFFGVIFTTHDLHELSHSSRIILLADKTIKLDTSLDKVKKELSVTLLTLPILTSKETLKKIEYLVGNFRTVDNKVKFYINNIEQVYSSLLTILATDKNVASINLHPPKLEDIFYEYLG